MYDHPIKQAGLSMNRIIFSNTMMVMGGFPNAKAQQFQLSFKYRTFNNGTTTDTQCKFQDDDFRIWHLSIFTNNMFVFIDTIDYNADDLDNVMPARQVGVNKWSLFHPQHSKNEPRCLQRQKMLCSPNIVI